MQKCITIKELHTKIKDVEHVIPLYLPPHYVVSEDRRTSKTSQRLFPINNEAGEVNCIYKYNYNDESYSYKCIYFLLI